LNPSSSAFVAPGAPPSPFERPRGFPRRVDSRNVNYGRPSRGVQLSFRVLPFACRPRSFPASSLARPDPSRNAGSASRDCCSHERLRRVPLSPRRRRDAFAEGEGCRSLTGTVLRVLAPLDGSGCFTARACSWPEHAARRDDPDASRPCFMPLASLELPSRAFTFRGAVPALAGLCFHAGSRFDCGRRDVPESSRSLSPPRRPFASARP